MAVSVNELANRSEITGGSESGVSISPIFSSSRYKKALATAQKGLEEPNLTGAHFDNLKRIVDGNFILDRGEGYVDKILEIQQIKSEEFVDGQLVTIILLARETLTETIFREIERRSVSGIVISELARSNHKGYMAKNRAQGIVNAYLTEAKLAN